MYPALLAESVLRLEIGGPSWICFPRLMDDLIRAPFLFIHRLIIGKDCGFYKMAK